jgi:VWFA-related protein
MNEAGHIESKVNWRIRGRRSSDGPAGFFGSRTVTLVVAIFVCFVGFATVGRAQDDVIRVETELAAFEVSVSDSKGNPVRNLNASDFRLFEDGAERPIEFFQPIKKQDKGRPLSIVFALDVSGSMTAAEIERLRAAMQDFIDRLGDYNSYFAVLSFAMNVQTLQSFTNRPERLERSFEKLASEQEGLSTHAYDAVDDAIRLIEKRSPKLARDRVPKRAVIVITDGFPVGDTVRPDTVIERANTAQTTVYSVILPSFSRLQRNGDPLLTPFEASGLMEKTGGKSFYAGRKNFDPLFEALAEEVTSTYAVAYYPTENRARARRDVRIEPKRSGLIVRQNRTTLELK